MFHPAIAFIILHADQCNIRWHQLSSAWCRLSGQSPPDIQRRFLSLRNFTGLNFGRSKSAEGINRNDIPRSQSGSSASSQQLKPSPAKRAVR